MSSAIAVRRREWVITADGELYEFSLAGIRQAARFHGVLPANEAAICEQRHLLELCKKYDRPCPITKAVDPWWRVDDRTPVLPEGVSKEEATRRILEIAEAIDWSPDEKRLVPPDGTVPADWWVGPSTVRLQTPDGRFATGDIPLKSEPCDYPWSPTDRMFAELFAEEAAIIHKLHTTRIESAEDRSRENTRRFELDYMEDLIRRYTPR